jgi:NaMN:DMB phosphoribosyltransferase
MRAYEAGVVKEGVGAGGAAIAAIIKSKGSITKNTLLKEIERNYERLVASK